MTYDANGELMHYGVKGMKWGVRRYQNYDGTYTRLGLARYRQAEADYDRKRAGMLKARDAYRHGGGSKAAYDRARSSLKTSKQNLKRSYSRLKDDYNADEGRKLYNKGVTSKKAGRRLAIGGAGAAALAIGGKAARDASIIYKSRKMAGKVNPFQLGTGQLSLGTGKQLATTIVSKRGKLPLSAIAKGTIVAGSGVVAAILARKLIQDKRRAAAYERRRKGYDD